MAETHQLTRALPGLRDTGFYVGGFDLPGSTPTEGDDLEVDTTVNPLAEGQPAYIVTLDAAIGAGNLEVRREAA